MVDRCYKLDEFIKYKKKIYSGKSIVCMEIEKKSLLTRSDNFYKGIISLVNWFLIVCYLVLK